MSFNLAFIDCKVMAVLMAKQATLLFLAYTAILTTCVGLCTLARRVEHSLPLRIIQINQINILSPVSYFC